MWFCLRYAPETLIQIYASIILTPNKEHSFKAKLAVSTLISLK